MEKGVLQKRVYFLGAGASKASEFELPTMGEFFQEKDFTNGNYGNLHAFTTKCFPKQKISELNLEDVITRLELSMDKFGAFGEHFEPYLLDARREFNDYVQKRLTYPPKDGRYWCEKHKVLFEQLTDQDSIITLNYDLIIDHTLFEILKDASGQLCYEHAVKIEKLPTGVQFPRTLEDKIRYDPFQKRLIFKGNMKEKEKEEYLSLSQEATYKEAIESLYSGSGSDNCLLIRIDSLLNPIQYFPTIGRPSLPREYVGLGFYLKLHGSVDWIYCANSMCGNHQLFFPNKIGSERIYNSPRELCTHCGSPLVSIIIPPTMNKTFDEYPKLGLLWSLAYREIRDADELVLIGMSLPGSDYYLKWLINSAISSRDEKEKTLKVVAVNKFKYKIEKLTGVSPEYHDDFCKYVDEIKAK